MSRGILVVAIILVLSLIGLFLLALFLWWLLRHRDQERLAPAIELEARGPVSPAREAEALQPIAEREAVPEIELPPEQPEVPAPDLEWPEPEAEAPPRDVDLPEPEVEVELPEVELPDVDLPERHLEILAPEAEGPEAGLQRFQEAADSLASDDLKRIEGIGPKISRVLQDAGIRTFVDLAAAETSRLEQILEEADSRLRRLADPTTWPEQAALAAAGDWDGLERLQGALKGGRRRD